VSLDVCEEQAAVAEDEAVPASAKPRALEDGEVEQCQRMLWVSRVQRALSASALLT